MPAKVDTMAYVGERPWHGLGNEVPKDANVDEVLVKAGLDWEVDTADVQYRIKDAEGKWTWRRDPSSRVLYRVDTGEKLDVVGPEYTPMQNTQVFEFFREYVDQGQAWIETAGSLDGGRYVWALAKMDESFTLPGEDKVEGYVFLANPHQYAKGIPIKFTSIRVVCWNTYTRAIAGGGGVKLWHTKEITKEVLDEAKRRLGIAREQLDAFAQDAYNLTRFELTQRDAIKLLVPVFGGDEDKPLIDQPRRTKRVISLWEGEGAGSTLQSAQGTAWGLFNGVTQYVDHEWGRTTNNRIAHAWLGGGEVVKRKALQGLLKASRN